MASLYQKPNGYYQAQFFDSDRTPKKKRFSLGTKDRSEARQILANWERKQRLGEIDVWEQDPRKIGKRSNTLTLAEAYKRLLQSRREMNCTEETLRTYRETVGYLTKKVGPEKPLKCLTASQVRSYIHAGKIAAATSEKRYRTLKTFFGFLKERGQIKESPLSKVAKPKIEKRLPVAWTKKELKAVCEEIKADYRRLRRKNQIPAGRLIWRINVYWFSFLTGLRRSEIARLRWRDVDLEGQVIILRQQKSRKEERLPISEKTASILQRIDRGEADDFVFRSPYSTKKERKTKSWGNRMTRTLAKYRDQAGVREDLDFHALRKGFCSQLAKNGASAMVIKRAARHADIQTSMLYIEMHQDTIRDYLDAAF